MGVVTQFNTLDRQCTVFENVYYHCRYFGMSHAQSASKANELIELFKLTERAKSNVAQLSGGLAQRVQIARAIAHEPQVLFLDEPSAGLDPQTRLALWDIIRVLRQRGITIVLTTHYMEEADALCESVRHHRPRQDPGMRRTGQAEGQCGRAEGLRAAPAGRAR